jgi:hypothetical protein
MPVVGGWEDIKACGEQVLNSFMESFRGASGLSARLSYQHVRAALTNSGRPAIHCAEQKWRQARCSKSKIFDSRNPTHRRHCLVENQPIHLILIPNHVSTGTTYLSVIMGFTDLLTDAGLAGKSLLFRAWTSSAPTPREGLASWAAKFASSLADMSQCSTAGSPLVPTSSGMYLLVYLASLISRARISSVMTILLVCVSEQPQDLRMTTTKHILHL